MNSYPIGILDSGVGGLTILREIVYQLPFASTVYIADSANCPYGSKPQERIHELAKKLVRFLSEKDCKLIVVACNTISVSCLDMLRFEFPDISFVGTVPAIRTAVKHSDKGCIGILSTTATSESLYLKELIAQFAKNCTIINRGTDDLVPFVEQGIVEGAEIMSILNRELAPFQEADIDCLVLGCSHFPFLRSAIQKILSSGVEILDSADAIAKQTRKILEQEHLPEKFNNGFHVYYTTGDGEIFAGIERKLTNEAVNVEKVTLL